MKIQEEKCPAKYCEAFTPYLCYFTAGTPNEQFLKDT